MELAGPSLGRELRALALSHTAPVPAWHRLRSQSQSRVQTAPSHNKCAKWSAAFSIHVSSAVAQPCGPLGLLLWEVSHRYPVVDGTRPGVAMVVGHARCALQNTHTLL